jgi:hypothetical protein
VHERVFSSAYFLFFLAVAAAGPAAQRQVSPIDRTALEGSSSTVYPLGRWNARVQQIHADLGAQARTLNGHGYRRDAATVRGQVPGFRTELEISLSMSPLPPDQASSVFADNVGAGPTTVLPRTWISFPATNRPGDAPAPTFELQIPYQVPFAYPSGGGALCVDTIVWGNDRAGVRDANFAVLTDAHEVLVNGVNDQPGYRFGQGCTAQGNSAAYANFTLRRLPTGTDLIVQSRAGMASDSTGSAFTVLMFGAAEASVPWHLRPDCTRWTTMDAFHQLFGANDASGNWDGTVKTAGQLPAGMKFWLQAASVHPINGTALSDGSRMIVPPPGPGSQTVARIAHGDDRASPLGTVSNVVPVTEFF